MFTDQHKAPKDNRPKCWLCKKPIKTRVYYQGHQQTLPCHFRCRVVIKVSKDGGI